MLHSFLLIGQSNAAGRGFLTDAAPLDTRGGRIKVLRNGRWVDAFRPINPDRPFSGVCLAERFATLYADAHPDCEVGIIPCADGGTQIAQWLPGEVLFENAVHCAQLAMRSSRLTGILWHQGEGDCGEERYLVYEARFRAVMDGIRDALGCPSLPVMIGGLGDFLAHFEAPLHPISQCYGRVNEVLRRLGRQYPNAAFVSAEGLGGNPDNLHFSADALNTLGARYYEAFLRFSATDEAPLPPSNAEKMTALELL